MPTVKLIGETIGAYFTSTTACEGHNISLVNAVNMCIIVTCQYNREKIIINYCIIELMHFILLYNIE